MSVQGPSLGSKAFGEHTDSNLIVACHSHQDALRFLSSALSQPNGIALLQGPRGAGKSTIIREQLNWLRRESAVAIFDGARESTRQLVSGMLTQYGVDVIPQQDEQMLQALGNFLTQKTRDDVAPILIIDNADRLGSSTLSLLNWLAALDVRGALGTAHRADGGASAWPISPVKHSMRNLERRHPSVFTLNPLSHREAVIYLRTRLIAAGGDAVEEVFPIDVCEVLHETGTRLAGPAQRFRARSHGAHGRTQGHAFCTTRYCDLRTARTLAEYALTKRECIIGRDEMADIVIDDKYVSKLHAMLQLYSNAVVLLDLNSTNGTVVNSVDTTKKVLRNNDIISLGSHRLKVENLPAVNEEMAEKIRAADTLTIKNLDDIRRSRARHNIVALKHRQST